MLMTACYIFISFVLWFDSAICTCYSSSSSSWTQLCLILHVFDIQAPPLLEHAIDVFLTMFISSAHPVNPRPNLGRGVWAPWLSGYLWIDISNCPIANFEKLDLKKFCPLLLWWIVSIKWFLTFLLHLLIVILWICFTFSCFCFITSPSSSSSSSNVSVSNLKSSWVCFWCQTSSHHAYWGTKEFSNEQSQINFCICWRLVAPSTTMLRIYRTKY